MARRDNQINIYVDEDLHEEIVERADEADCSKSGYVVEVLERHVESQLAIEVNHQSAVERRLEELAAHAAEKITAATEGLEAGILRAGVYAIATWELVKQDYGEVERRQAIEAGSRRMREEADALGIDLDPATEPEATPDDPPGPTYTPDDDGDDDGEWYF